jgi:hypothetical protein
MSSLVKVRDVMRNVHVVTQELYEKHVKWLYCRKWDNLALIVLLVCRMWRWRELTDCRFIVYAIAGVPDHHGKGPLEIWSFCYRHGSVALCDTTEMAEKSSFVYRIGVTCAGTDVYAHAVLNESGS